jgi:hypothetical protein
MGWLRKVWKTVLRSALGNLARIIHDTALRAVLKTSPGLALSEGPRRGPQPKPEKRISRTVMNNPG